MSKQVESQSVAKAESPKTTGVLQRVRSGEEGQDFQEAGSPVHESRFQANLATIPVRKASNQTGLPDDLKAGVEALSGFSMDDVRVHYNSSKPAQLQALAYTQGTEIHVGPGQERHLAHEAWHVVQQKQGRVKETTQINGIAINDDITYEKEATEQGRVLNKKNYPTRRKTIGVKTECQPREVITQLERGIMSLEEELAEEQERDERMWREKVDKAREKGKAVIGWEGVSHTVPKEGYEKKPRLYDDEKTKVSASASSRLVHAIRHGVKAVTVRPAEKILKGGGEVITNWSHLDAAKKEGKIENAVDVGRFAYRAAAVGAAVVSPQLGALIKTFGDLLIDGKGTFQLLEEGYQQLNAQIDPTREDKTRKAIL